jgi:mevalonate kinase
MIQLAQKSAIGTSHGKIILLGEHSVVYGMPAIAIPFPSLEVSATVEEIPGPMMISCDYYEGPLSQAPVKMQGIAACINETLNILNRAKTGLLIRVDSNIPIGRGLGSSAAIAIAIVKTLFAFNGRHAHLNQLMSLVHIAEIYAHGNPSGIDMFAASCDYPIWFQKGKRIEPLQINAPFFLVVADTGRIGDTHGAVSCVKDAYQNSPKKTQKSLENLGVITHEAKFALSKGDIYRVGRLLDFAQDELVAIGISDEGLNELVEVARNAGALGAKLTGGGRGGCIIALAQNQLHANAIAKILMEKGASNTWYFSLESQIRAY